MATVTKQLPKQLTAEKYNEYKKIGKFKNIDKTGTLKIKTAKRYWTDQCKSQDGQNPTFSLMFGDNVYGVGSVINIGGRQIALNTIEDFATAVKLAVGSGIKVGNQTDNVYNFYYMVTGPADKVYSWIDHQVKTPNSPTVSEIWSTTYTFVTWATESQFIVNYENMNIEYNEYMKLVEANNSQVNQKAKKDKKLRDIERKGTTEVKFTFNDFKRLADEKVTSDKIVSPALIGYLTAVVEKEQGVVSKSTGGKRGGRATDINQKIASAVEKAKILNVTSIDKNGAHVNMVNRPTPGSKSTLVPLQNPEFMRNGVSYVYYNPKDQAKAISALTNLQGLTGVDLTPQIQAIRNRVL